MVKWRQNVQRKCGFVPMAVHKRIEVICISTSSLLELCCAKTITWIPWGPWGPDARAQGISWWDTNCPLWLVASGCTTGKYCLSISCRTCSCGLCYERRLCIVQINYSSLQPVPASQLVGSNSADCKRILAGFQSSCPHCIPPVHGCLARFSDVQSQ